MTLREPRPNWPKLEQTRGKLQPARGGPAGDLQAYGAVLPGDTHRRDLGGGGGGNEAIEMSFSPISQVSVRSRKSMERKATGNTPRLGSDQELEAGSQSGSNPSRLDTLYCPLTGKQDTLLMCGHYFAVCVCVIHAHI